MLVRAILSFCASLFLFARFGSMISSPYVNTGSHLRGLQLTIQCSPFTILFRCLHFVLALVGVTLGKRARRIAVVSGYAIGSF